MLHGYRNAASRFAASFLAASASARNTTLRAEHPDYERDLNFKKAKTEALDEQRVLI